MRADLRKVTLVALLLFLITVFPVLIQADNTSEDMSYLGEGLKAPPVVRLMDNTHPVTRDLIGKEYHFNYETNDTELVAVAYFVDEQNMEWWAETDPDKLTRKVKYAAFKIRDKLYYVTWVDPKDMAETAQDTKVWYDENYIVAFVLDLEKMVATDSYMRPHEKDGSQHWFLMQASITVKNHEE